MKYPKLELVEATFTNRLKRKVKDKFTDSLVPALTRRLPRRFRRFARVTEPKRFPTVNAALIGAGNVAHWAYLPRIRSSHNFRLTGVFDVCEEAVDRVSSEFKAKKYPSVEAAISDDDVSAVFICSPPQFHREAVIAALHAGKHVLCEKPLAGTFADAAAMWDTARDANVRHMVNFSYRFRPDVNTFVRIVHSGLLGTIYHAGGMFGQGDWFSEGGEPTHSRGDDAPWRYQPGGGVVPELGSHLVDLFRLCLGEVVKVGGWTREFGIERIGLDNASGMTLQFKNEMVAQLTASRLVATSPNHLSLEVCGSSGSARYENGSVSVWTRKSPNWRTILAPTKTAEDFLAAFHESIHVPSKVVPGFWDGFKNCEVLEAVFMSATTGNTIDLPLGSPST